MFFEGIIKMSSIEIIEDIFFFKAAMLGYHQSISCSLM